MTAVAVVGSGVVGASIAYHLAARGAAVTLIDGAGPAQPPSASWASAGGLRSQGRHPAEQPLTLAAAERWQTLAEELDANLQCRFGGHLHLAETPDEVEALEARITADQAGGVATERLEPVGIAAIAPALTGRAVMAAWTPQDGQADAALTTRAFADAAERRGARLLFGRTAAVSMARGRAEGVLLDDGTRVPADIVVLATGAWSAALLKPLGIELAIGWHGLQMLLSDPTAPLLGPTVTAVGRNLSLKQTPSSALMVGGRWRCKPAGEPHGVVTAEELVAPQWAAAAALLPVMLGLSVQRQWVGAEAQTPDGLPIIGRLDREGLYMAAGCSGHGFQLAPAIGDLVSKDLIDKPQVLLAPFRPDRFFTLS